MNTFTKVLLTVPFLFGTVACAGEDRIVTGPNPIGSSFPDVTVNCTKRLVRTPGGRWMDREDHKGTEKLFDYGIKEICG